MSSNRPAKKAAPAAAPIDPPAEDTASGDTTPADPPEPAAPTTPEPAAPTAAPQPAAAPLAAPIEPPNTAPPGALLAPLPAVPMGADAFLGYVDDAGNPIDPDDLFDMSGMGTVVTAKVRANALIQRGGSKTKLMSLAFPTGMEVNRATAREAIERARAAACPAGDN